MRIRSALTYPLILAVTACAVVAVIVLYLIPALLPLFAEAGTDPPAALALAERVQLLLAAHWPVFLGSVAVAGVLLRNLLRRERMRVLFDQAILRVPLIGEIVAQSNVGLLARTLGSLLRNGVPVVSALTMTAAALPNRAFAAAIRAAAEGVREGRRLATMIDAAPCMPKLLVRFVAIGEEASKLDDMLLHLAEMMEEDAQRHIDRFMTLLTPVLTIAIGVAIGGVMVSVMQAILSVNRLALP
jgi:general secretion pathway protein F